LVRRLPSEVFLAGDDVHRRRGFTLLEMVVVVAILAVVAGTAIVALGGTEDDARTLLARSEMATLRDALVRWKQDIGSFPDTSGSLTPLVALALGRDPAGNVTPLPDPSLASTANGWVLANPGTSVPPALTFPSASLSTWNPATRRGWRGPYLSIELTSRLLVINEKDSSPGTYELADPWDHMPTASDPATLVTDRTRRSFYVYTPIRDGSGTIVGFTVSSNGPNGIPASKEAAGQPHDYIVVSYP
jgi:prepilin-type N-terminal cleavage/methylation domain-containing protein